MNTQRARCAALLSMALASMAATAASITGFATYRERIALPSDAAFEVVVEDVSRADAPGAVIGRLSRMPAGQVPIAFEVPYVEPAVQQTQRYGLRASITHGGRKLFATTQPYPVLTGGAGTQVDVLLHRVALDAKPDRTLTNTYWKLIELQGVAVKMLPKQREPHLILESENGRLAGSGGCNRMMGGYQVSGASISFGRVASTMMACADGMDQESVFFKALERVGSWRVQGDHLDLLDDAGTALARFVAVDVK